MAIRDDTLKRKVLHVIEDCNLAVDELRGLVPAARSPRIVLQQAALIQNVALRLVSNDTFGFLFQEGGTHV